ncbi:hypothetical protein HAX54_031559 [Datura stramonium]|uniref:Anaphase-promoting complex subunit 1 N-terminal domain-containing protein n=1 Tax=Datura stramonium TaxID=4076 RepID=A0ABS8RNB9_DATST|nr:hypothetical protein [Datura stramonium]
MALGDAEDNQPEKANLEEVCWCRMGHASDTVLCILLSDSLSIYDTSGEVTSVPLPRSITSIWPLPYGLLLQQAPEGSSAAHIQFSSLNPFLSARDTIRSKRDVSPQQNYTAVHGLDFTIKGDGSSMSSHLILKDPLEEPQPTYIEERGKLNFIKEFDERTIWTGDCVPLMASYNKAKLQHSLWVVETINSNIEMGNSRFPDVPVGVLTKQFSFRRIWQGKGSQTAASKVFLATDDDASPIICFLLQEQKKLLSLRLQTVEINTKVIYDIKPDMSWSIPAVAAAPVVVTRPGVKVGGLPFVDIVVLTSENTLLLYCGKQCLCRFKLSHLGKDQVLHDPIIVGLADAVEEHINVTVNSGRVMKKMPIDKEVPLRGDKWTFLTWVVSGKFNIIDACWYSNLPSLFRAYGGTKLSLLDMFHLLSGVFEYLQFTVVGSAYAAKSHTDFRYIVS